MTPAPAVTVSVPYFGCAPYVATAVESILAQTHAGLTVVVVNDGDPEPPWPQLAHIDDPRLVRFDLDANRGRYFADQVVLEASPHAFFLVQDADDWSEPERLTTLLALLEDDGLAAFSAANQHKLAEGVVVFHQYTGFGGIRRPLTAELDHRANHTGLFRSEALRAVGGYYAGFRLGYDTLVVNLLLMAGKVAYTRRPLYNTLLRPESLTHAPATAKGSPERARVARELQGLYDALFALYRRWLCGEIGRDELLRGLAGACCARVTQQDTAALVTAARRLRPLIEAARASAARPPRPSPGGPLVSEVIDHPALPWSAWSISRGLARALDRYLRENRPRRLLEAGSGVSTAVLAAYAAESGAELVSLEHDPQHFAATRRLLETLGLGRAVALRLAPLRALATPDGAHPWYHARLDGVFDFVLVDGPPLRHGRKAALFALAPHLAPAFELWLKDGKRRHERDCVALWRRHVGFEAELCGLDYRGVWVLKGTSGAAPPAPAPATPRLWSEPAQRRLVAFAERMGQATERRRLSLGFGYLYYGLARLFRPRTVVCIGSYRGFSPMCFALGLADNGEGVCHLVDPGLVDGYWHDPATVPGLERAFAIAGHFRHLRKTTRAAVADRALPGSIDFLYIDGDHSYAGVKLDFDALAPRVPSGGLIFFHDARNEGQGGFTPWEVKRFLRAEVLGRPDFEALTLPIAAGLAILRHR